MFVFTWGVAATDILTPGDYDGDAKSDLAIWRPAEGRYYIRRSLDGGMTAINWGALNDYPIANSWVH